MQQNITSCGSASTTSAGCAAGSRGLRCLASIEAFLPVPAPSRDGSVDITASSFGDVHRQHTTENASKLLWQFKFALAATLLWDLAAAAALVAAAATPAAAPASLSPLLVGTFSLTTVLLVLLSTSTRHGVAWRRLHNACLHRLLAPALLPMCVEQRVRRWSGSAERRRGRRERAAALRRASPATAAAPPPTPADAFGGTTSVIGVRDPGPIDHTGMAPSQIAAHWHTSGFSVALQNSQCDPD